MINEKEHLLIEKLSNKLISLKPQSIKIMEVCGTHTNTVMKYGIRKLLPMGVMLITGPGCPVCVTPSTYIDNAIELALEKGAVILAYGDLIRVPGSTMSLMDAKALGGDVRIVYSPFEALKIASIEKNKNFVFLSVGFETTTPSSAQIAIYAKEQRLNNFYMLCSNLTIPNALNALSNSLNAPNAFIFPGHVAAITGMKPFRDFCIQSNLSGVCAGFEATDVLSAIIYILENYNKGTFCHNLYTRVVKDMGNELAQMAVNKVFRACDANFRGIGIIKGSGLCLNSDFEFLDAEKKFSLKPKEEAYNKGCICGSILIGEKEPSDCPLFKNKCNPNNPVGACMVSYEGSCRIAINN